MEYIRLKDVTLSTQYGYTAEETSKTEGVYKYLRITDIVPYFVDLDTVPYCSIPQKKVEQYLVKEGDILIARTGATTGYNYVVPKGIKNTVYASYLIRFNVDRSKILPSYLKYVLKSLYYYGFVNNYIGGSAQPGMNARVFGRFNLPYNSLPLQRRIASILSAYDNLIENNNKRIRLLEQMAENLYKEWFVRFRFPGHETVEMENGLPKGWKYAKFEDILSLKDSARIPLSSLERSNMQKIYPYYGAASILDYVNDYLFDGVYLLLGEDGSVIDDNGYPYIQYVWGKFWVNNHAHVIEKKGVYSVEFLYCLFKRMNIQSIVTGVAQPKISQGRLFNKKVIKPSDSIISLFDKQIQPVFAGIRQLTEENKNLSRQRDLLLPRLMSGKLEVKE